jgi:hypothetical protein
MKHNQQQIPSQSVPAPNANSSSLNMPTVASTVFQQTMTDLNGAESEEDRIMIITRIILNLMKQNGRENS